LAFFEQALFSLLAYLLGSIPFSFLIARAQGVDLRSVGSGNIGATNVARSLGVAYGALALLLDGAKGFTAAYLASLWGFPIWLSAFSVVGHNWSIFMGLRSGKGVAASLGILLLISWPVLLLTLAIWGLVAWATRYISLASVSALIISPLMLLAWGGSVEEISLMAALGLLSALRHRENFKRLIRGEEFRLRG